MPRSSRGSIVAFLINHNYVHLSNALAVFELGSVSVVFASGHDSCEKALDYARCGSDPGPRHWREHSHLQRGQRSSSHRPERLLFMGEYGLRGGEIGVSYRTLSIGVRGTASLRHRVLQ